LGSGGGPTVHLPLARNRSRGRGVEGAASGGRQIQEIAVLEADAAARDAAGLGHEAQDRERAHRLAAAGFAHQRHRLAGVDAIGDAVDRLDDAVRARNSTFRSSISSRPLTTTPP
jgi:hypothetical protein